MISLKYIQLQSNVVESTTDR